MDDICVIKSLNGNDNEHYNATLGMHTGSFFFSRPSIGSWVSYGLGTENQNLPSFIALAPQMPYAGTQIFNNDFLPAYHQGVRVIGGREPIANVARRSRQRGLAGIGTWFGRCVEQSPFATTRRRFRIVGPHPQF